MSSAPPGSHGTNRPPSLAHAAESLAKAAITLSEAAQAMSIAAQALSSRASGPLSHSNRAIGPASGVSGDGEERVDNTSTDQALRSDPGDTTSAEITEKASVDEPDGSYRILVDNEVDVLLFVCSLIGRNQKFLCYMNCSIPAFPLYQKLVNDVTEMPVHIMTEITAAELERVESDFLEDLDGVLLLPETVCPDMKLADADSWVIHIGWPADKRQYQAQKKAHQAKNNILVAHSKDENRYPAGSAVMAQSQPWPGNDVSFGISVDVLRPLFEERLVAMPSRFKDSAYRDWITGHGPKGHRYIRSWTASDLVYHANLYLLDVLRYHGPKSRGTDSTTQVPLPEVSAEFVTNNGLEFAVEEGVLRVEPGYQITKNDSVPPGTTSLNETTTSGPPISSNPLLAAAQGANQRNMGKGDIGGPAAVQGSGSTLPNPGATDNSNTRSNPFKPTNGFTYFALQEEFDAVPLICFLIQKSAREKVALFFEDSGSMACYQQLIGKITGRIVITTHIGNSDRANEDAALRFVALQSPGVLLLCYNCKTLPARLKGISLGYCIYWGAGDYVPLVQAKSQRTELSCLSTSIIMTAAYKYKVEGSLRDPDIREHPSSTDLLDFSESAWLSPIRNAMRSVLIANNQLANSLYEARLYFLANVPRSVRSAEEVARRANQFSARVLLRGRVEDGSENFPPVAGRFSTSSRIVKSFALQPAVGAGLLTVGS